MLPVDMESYFMRMEMFMKGTGKTTRQMAMVSILRRMEWFIRVNGRMISSMEKVSRFGVRMLNMRGIMLLVRRLGKDV